MKKVISIDESTGMETEVLVLGEADVTDHNVGKVMGVMTKEDGFLDPSLIKSTRRLSILKICSETISALKIVVNVDEEHVRRGSPDSYNNARILGVSLTSGNAGDIVDVLLFGILRDDFFDWEINTPLYLGMNGEITDQVPVLPTSSFQSYIGYSLGSGAIFIKPREPIQL